MVKNFFIFIVLIHSHIPVDADSYAPQTDYRVACIALKTGQLIWQTTPGKLGAPQISLIGDTVIVESHVYKDRNWEHREKVDYVLDAKIGAVIREPTLANRSPQPTVGPLATLPRNLIDSEGNVYEFRDGNTRHLTRLVNGRSHVVRKLDNYPSELQIYHDLALFTFADGSSIGGSGGSGGGEVYAYNLRTNQLQWEFDASTVIANLDEGAYTSINTDDDKAYVSTDQTLSALECKSGKLLWSIKLPRQKIRVYDSPWIEMGRADGLLLVQCYDSLFAIDPNGKLLWSFDCGAFGCPWPTVDNDRLYVATRDGRIGRYVSERSSHLRNTAVVVLADPQSELKYKLDFVSRRDIPRDVDIWWSLRPPQSSAKTPKIELKLVEDFDGRYSETSIDITRPIHEDGRAYAKFGRWIDKAVLVVDGKEILQKIKPGSPLERSAN